MQKNINSFMGYSVGARDGIIGKVEDFYFDEKTWTIRYLVVNTGTWLSGRKVLISLTAMISPEALIKDSRDAATFPVNLTREQVLNSPESKTDEPISRQHEAQLANYYPWEAYWGTGFSPGRAWGVIPPTPVMTLASLAEQEKIEETVLGLASREDSHLRSIRTVTGYHIHATDDDIGHVNDFMIDTSTWQIIFLVVDTHNWIGGAKVLIPVRHISKIQWENARVFIDMTVESIRQSPVFEKIRTAKEQKQ
ncbi:MAG: PRC-barrel domain-containing protein [Puia sp.]|nr:PRC-barrel domain-containing protein [Puia sp.]